MDQNTDLEPLECEGGFQFQFVSVPSASSMEQSYIQSSSWQSPSCNLSNIIQKKLDAKDPKENEIFLIESEGSDEEMIKKNIIIKNTAGLVKKQKKTCGGSRLSEESNKITSPRKELASTLEIEKQLPQPTTSSENIKKMVDILFPIKPKTKKTQSNKVVQVVLPGKSNSLPIDPVVAKPVKDTKGPIYYKTPVNASQKFKIFIQKPPSSSPVNSDLITMEGSTSFAISQTTASLNSGSSTVQQNQVGKGTHQKISNSPMIVNSPDIRGIDASIRHYILPKSKSNAASLRPNLLKTATNAVLKVVKVVTPDVSTNRNHSFDLSPQKLPVSNLRVKTLSSLMETPAKKTVETEKTQKTFQQPYLYNIHDTKDCWDYPEFVQLDQLSDINNINSQQGNNISTQYKNSLDIHNGLSGNLIQLQKVATNNVNIPKIGMPQSVVQTTNDSNDNNKPQTVRNLMKNSKNEEQPKFTYSQTKPQMKNWTYLEINKVYPGKKSLNTASVGPNLGPNNTKKINEQEKKVIANSLEIKELSSWLNPKFKHKTSFSCFTTEEWMVSNRHQGVEFGFKKSECIDKQCKSTLSSNINILKNKLTNQCHILQELERITCEKPDNDLLVTRKVVILNNGSEEDQATMLKRKKIKKRLRFMPKKGFSKKKSDHEPMSRERPMDYRVYSKISAMKKLHNIRPCYIEMENNELVKKALALYNKNKKCFLKLTPFELRLLTKKDKESKEMKQANIFMNWFNNKIITNLTKFKISIASEKPMLLINKENINELRHYKQFNIVFPASKILPDNLPRNKGFVQLVGLGHVKIVDTKVLSDYFREL